MMKVIHKENDKIKEYNFKGTLAECMSGAVDTFCDIVESVCTGISHDAINDCLCDGFCKFKNGFVKLSRY